MAASSEAVSRLRFGAFEFDEMSGELYRQGERIRLQEQPRQVLAALLRRPGEVVTRDDLRERLWKGDTFVDFEHGLNTAIKKARHALGDSAEEPQFIETLPRRGYRFIAPVIRLEPSAPIEEAGAAIAREARVLPDDSRAGRSPFVTRVLLALLLLAGVIGAAWLARTPVRSSSPAARAQLAVLPFRVLTQPAAESSYLGVGIADAITTRLANVRQVVLRPTSAVLAYRDTVTAPSEIASALGVEHLLVGTIQPAEHAYRVAVQLVGADGVAVWGRTYDVTRADLLRLQDDVAEQVVAALRLELSGRERARLSTRFTANAEAYDGYLRGRALLLNYTDANMREAIQRFEEALERDPDFSLARAALATACAWFSVRYAYESEAAIWGKRAEEEARRALAQDAALADAHLAIASAAGTLHRGFDWQTLVDEAANALALDPSLDLAHVARMRAFYHLGMFEEARLESRRARALNPTPSVETARLEIAVQLFEGHFAAAAAEATALLQRTDAPAIRHYLGLARFYLGDAAGAREMLASARRGGQPDVRAQASLASIEAASGLRTEARARAQAVERGSYMDHHVAYSLGAVWAQLGHAEASVRWLRQAADSGFPCYPWFARDSLLNPVRGEPAFRELMAYVEAQRKATR
jgi:DNA-binding winged helix-turn-helix (wHTH) protein/TolB-like protein